MSTPGMTTRIPIRFGLLTPLLVVLGLTRRQSFLEIAAEHVRVRMGWAFRVDVPRSSISQAQAARAALSIGVHGWRGRWLVNGAAGPLVRLTIEPAARGRFAGLPIRVRELTVSVDDASELLDRIAVAGHHACDRPTSHEQAGDIR